MGSKLYVGGLPFAATEAQLTTLFAAHGTVESARVIADKFTGQSRGFGFVEMSTPEEAKAAITALNGSQMDGRSLTVNEAKPQEPRSGGGGGRFSSGGGRARQRFRQPEPLLVVLDSRGASPEAPLPFFVYPVGSNTMLNADVPSQDLRRAYPNYATTILFSLISIGALIGVPLFGFSYGYSWLDWAMFGILYVMTGLGITVGYHRLMAHRSFDCPNWVKAGFLIVGGWALKTLHSSGQPTIFAIMPTATRTQIPTMPSGDFGIAIADGCSLQMAMLMRSMRRACGKTPS